MIKEKIYEFLELNENQNIPEEVLEQFINSTAFGLKRQVFAKRKPSGLRLSIVGKCPRQVYYNIKNPELAKALSPRAKFIFLSGDIWESIIVAIAKASGVNLHSEQKEVIFEGVKGHIDGIATLYKDFLIEIKSMSEAGFKMSSKFGISNDYGYLSQLNVYLYALGLEQGIFLFVNKNTGALEEQIVTIDMNIVEDARKNIRAIREAEKSNIPPKRKYDFIEEIFRRQPTGKLRLPHQCSYCPFVEHCWGDEIQLEFKSGKPVYYKKEAK